MTPGKIRELELLAPARNIGIGIAAIDCGADAVYIAGPKFGARQAAGNEIADIASLCSYAHKFGARIFITLNTILFDNETDLAAEQLIAVRDAGADAIIVQDLAVPYIARKTGVDLPLHASTQCAIRTPEQARVYEDLGFSRLILERELSLEQIRAIREAVSCELEFFVHGALCVCYSGQCYMSEAIAGRSANRGACIQACRSLYDLTDESGNTIVKNKALLSLKDYNLKNRLEDLAEAGISSFKIEGRLKNSSYVKNIVRDYSTSLDRLVSISGGKYCRASFGSVSGGFMPNPEKTFNRGYTELFIDGNRGQWSTFDSAKGMGEEIGQAVKISPEKNKFSIRPIKEIKLSNGDGLSFVARNSEVVGFRADICNGLEIRCKNIRELYEGARIFRNSDIAFEKEIENNSPAREIEVRLKLSVCRKNEGNFTISVHATSEDGRKNDFEFTTLNQAAENQERMKAVFKSQLEKTSGHYRFILDSVTTDKCPLPFLPASALNGIRRQVAEKIDTYECIRRPLENRTPASESYYTTDAGEQPYALSHITYKSNVSNNIAKKAYLDKGAESVENAFELEHRDNIELMRMKYCIRYELGICPKQQKVQKSYKELFLVNNGKRFPLLFDCKRCEMAVLSPIQEFQK